MSDEDSRSLGNLRAVVTAIVVAHHAVLAWNPIAPPPNRSLADPPMFWAAFPVVDAAKSGLLGLFTSFNDMFFMALMFFLSGLFVWKSLVKKGSARFLRDRALRLGVPFLIAAAVIAPLAYYPAYVQTGATDGFWKEWLSLGVWPAGPAWFIWVLLAFDTIAALLYVGWPRWGESVGRLYRERPLAFFFVVVAISAIAYIPLAIGIGPFDWGTLGPFAFQKSRVLHYAAYFFIGVGAGARGLELGAFREHWVRWNVAALLAFGVAIALFLVAISAPAPSVAMSAAGAVTFVLSCASSSFAFIALAARFGDRRGSATASLRSNAYGIYLLHYAFVSWVLLALVRANVPVLLKALVATSGALALAWVASAALRRIPVVARLI